MESILGPFERSLGDETQSKHDVSFLRRFDEGERNSTLLYSFINFFSITCQFILREIRGNKYLRFSILFGFEALNMIN